MPLVAIGSNGDGELWEKRENIHETCGNGATSRPGFSIPNSPRRHSRNGSHVN